MGGNGPEDELKLSDQLCFAAYSVSQAFGRAYKPLLDPLGLTYPQYLVLLVLWEGGEQTVGQIGQKLRLDSGTLTPLLKRMEAAGLVRRLRNPEDERQVLISVTDRGLALRGPVAEARRQVGCATGLSSADLHALKDAIDRLRSSLDGERSTRTA